MISVFFSKGCNGMRMLIFSATLFFGILNAELPLSGKYAFVTGGSSGIGKAIVETFVENGAHVIFTYHQNESAANEIVQRLNTPEQRLIAVQMNILDPESVDKCLETVIKEFPQLQIVVNNAGILDSSYFLDTQTKEFNETIQANVTTPFIISQKLAKQMIDQKVNGSIILIGSFRGERPVSRLFAYCTSKAALNSMTLMMAHELAPNGIRVNLIAPGGTMTAMSRKIYDTEEKVRERGERVPLKRYGRPDDHAALAVYLASDASNWTTGTIIPVDGGESTQN